MRNCRVKRRPLTLPSLHRLGRSSPQPHSRPAVLGPSASGRTPVFRRVIERGCNAGLWAAANLVDLAKTAALDVIDKNDRRRVVAFGVPDHRRRISDALEREAFSAASTSALVGGPPFALAPASIALITMRALSYELAA